MSNHATRMARLRALHAEMPRDIAPLPGGARSTRRSDVRAHPEFQKVKVARSAAHMLEIESPFFRAADDVSGTRARIGGRWVENFSSYDYLSLNQDPRLVQAVADAVSQQGVSARASRLVGGELALHRQLEESLAGFIGTEAALATVSGHATNVAVIRTLMRRGDVVLVDERAHNSVFEGLRASDAHHLTMPHSDPEWLDDWLAANRDRFDNVLVVVEGLYSMDGDKPDLPALVEIKERHGAWLMLDEAHSIGVLGARGAGLCDEFDIPASQVDIVMGTLSKAFCSCGGFVAGSADIVDLLRHAAPGFVYSVGLSVPNTAAALTALSLLRAEPERVERLRKKSELFNQAARGAGLDLGPSDGHAIAPVIVGDSLRATRLSNRVFEDGYLAMPIIAPAVPDRQARLRFFLNADHGDEAIKEVVASVSSQIGKV